MSAQSLKLVIYYIRSEDSADKQFHTSVDMDTRLNELEITRRSLLFTSRNDDS
jgi:hypothetical protein